MSCPYKVQRGNLQSVRQQIQDALCDIDARIAGVGGTTITSFYVQDDGVTGQALSTSAADLAGIWDTPSVTDSDFSWNGTTGELTINTAGLLDLTAAMVAVNTGGNRVQLTLHLMYSDSSVGPSFNILQQASNYATRDGTQNEGGVWIPNWLREVDVGDKIKLRALYVGSACTVGSGGVDGQTYISAKLYT